MKFGKLYYNTIQNIFSNNDILYYNYKCIKKQIKYINKLKIFENKNVNINGLSYECPICLEEILETNHIKLPCCNQYFHPFCIINCMCHSNVYCPLCRDNLTNFFTTNYENYNIKILTLIANILLSMINIEKMYQKIIKKKRKWYYYLFLHIEQTKINKYCEINTIAILKSIKKINKNLGEVISGNFLKMLFRYDFFVHGVNIINKNNNYKNILMLIKND
jgi:hypothetical protein